MDIYFTKIDYEIESEMQRDPLGEEEIWTDYAKELFPNVNSVTNELKGYVISALIKDIIQKNEIIGKIPSKDYQIGSEIIIMLLMLKKNEELGKDVSFLGKNNGISLTKENFLIKRSSKKEIPGEKREILVRQEQLGYYGRYHSKIEENYVEILNAVFEDDEELKEKIEKWLTEKSEIIYEGIEYKNIFLDNDKEMKDALFEILKLENEKINNKILEILKIRNNKKISELYDEIKNTKDDKDVSARDIIIKTIGKLEKTRKNNELKNLLENIFELENFLIDLENLFYTILDKGNLKLLTNDYCDDSLRSSFDKLSEFENNSDIKLKKITYENSKYMNLVNALKSHMDKKEIIISLIKDHEIIMKKRKKAPWVEFQNGNITINHKIKQDYNKRDWAHNYFISNVMNIIRSTNQWK